MRVHKYLAAFAMAALSAQSFLPCFSASAVTGEPYYIKPVAYDNVIVNNAENLFVEGKLTGDVFTFTETKDIVFSFSFEEGWCFSEDYSQIFDGEALYTDTVEEDGTVNITYHAVKGRSVSVDMLENIVICASAEELPKIKIEIEGSIDDVTKAEWTKATIAIEAGTKEFATGDFAATGKIKGRGNYSWSKSQKPYSINLDEKASLLGLVNTRRYALVTPASDDSLIRNYITYKAGQKLEGIEYCANCELVEVYFNDEYAGIYALCERVRNEKDKINIEDATADNINGGYLIEKNVEGKLGEDSLDICFSCPYQVHDDLDLFTLKDPEEPTQEMLDSLEDLFERLDAAVMGKSDEDYTKYIDVDSWVDFVIMNEVAKNVDGNFKTSCFMIKRENSEVIEMTSLWDFDLAYGNADWDNETDNNHSDDLTRGDTVEGFMIINSSSPWHKALYYEHPDFKQALKERYKQYRSTIFEEMYNSIDELGAYLSASVKADETYVDADDMKEACDDLKEFLGKRLAWLDSQWLDADYSEEDDEEKDDWRNNSIKDLLGKVVDYAEDIDKSEVVDEIDDLFDNTLRFADDVLHSVTATSEDCDAVTFELLRMSGIVTYKHLSEDGLALLCEYATKIGMNTSTVADATEIVTKKSPDEDDVKAAWTKVMNELVPQGEKYMAEELLSRYGNVSTDNCFISGVKLYEAAKEAMSTVLNNEQVGQGELDAAAAELARTVLLVEENKYANLSSSNTSKNTLGTNNDSADGDTKDGVIWIIAIVAGGAVVLVAVVIIVITIKRKKKNKS